MKKEREEGEWKREKEQETRSHKQNSKFREAGTLLLRIWTFAKKHLFFNDFVKKKNATSEKQKFSF